MRRWYHHRLNSVLPLNRWTLIFFFNRMSAPTMPSTTSHTTHTWWMVCPERATRPARLTRGVMISSSTINTTAAYIGGLGLCSTAVTTCMLHPVFLGDASLKRGVGISPLAASFFLVPTLPSAALAVDRCKCTTSVHLSFSFPVANLPVIRDLVGRTTTILPYRDGGLRFGTYLSPSPPWP